MKKNIYFILGSPGAGKTHFSICAKKYYQKLGGGNFYVNLDPGNNSKNKKSDLGICGLVNCEEISTELHMGPNGAIIFAMEYLKKNLDWIEKKIELLLLSCNNCRLFIDLPGQIELFTHYSCLRGLIGRVNKKYLGVKAVFLTDSFLSKDSTINYSIFLSCLLTVFNLEIPCLHLLTKVDLFKIENKTHFSFSFHENKGFFRDLEFPKKKILWSSWISKKFREIVLDFSPLKTYPTSVKDSFLFKKSLLKIENLN